jgi:hypothetical protein
MTLVECTVRGLGTLAGERLLHANGVRVAEQRNLDLRDAGIRTAGLGQPYSSDRRFVGTLDFDDARVADRLQASRLWVDAGVSAFVRGQCAPVDVGFLDSEGGSQPMPYDVQLASVVLQAQLFSDPACASSLLAPTLVSGQTQLRLYVLPAVNSPVSIDFSFVDLVGASLVRPIVADVDGGTPDAGAADAGETDAGEADAGGADAGEPDGGVPELEPRSLAVGCGCTSVSPLWAFAGMMLLLRRARVSDR